MILLLTELFKNVVARRYDQLRGVIVATSLLVWN